MNFLKSLLPDHTPEWLINASEIEIIRERALQTMAITGSLVGFPGFIIIAWVSLANQRFDLFIAYSVIILATFGITLSRRLPHTIRVHLILIVLFASAIIAFAINGLGSNGRVFLIVIPIMAGILMGLRAALISGGLALTVMAVFAIGFSTGWLSPISESVLLKANSPIIWVESIFFFTQSSSLATVALIFLIENLRSSLRLQQQLSEELTTERESLSKRVEESSADIRRRLAQLSAAAEVSRAISRLEDPEELLQHLVDLIQERFSLYYSGIFLIDEQRRNAVLRAGTGEAGRAMLANNHRLSIGGNSMIGWTVQNRQPRIALDVGAEAVRFNNPYLPRTRSEMALPIVSRDEILGALTIQSDQPNAFDESDISILQSIADGVAIAIENSRLFEQTIKNLEEIRTLDRTFIQEAWKNAAPTLGVLKAEVVQEAVSGRGEPLNIPLNLREVEIGQIQVDLDRTRLTPEEQSFIEAVSTQTALALENARLFQLSEQRAIQEERLNQISAGFARATGIDEILRMAAWELGQLPSVTEVSVQLTNNVRNGRSE